MQHLIVNNPNIVIDAPMPSHAAQKRNRRRQEHQPWPEPQAEILRQLRQIRQEIEATACSSTWAEDWLYRGAEYAPDFQCDCPLCRSLFPHRRHPRPVRESDYSLDCQVETDEDPELAEDLALLRNDRPRFGSVFVGRGMAHARRGHVARHEKSTGETA